MLVIRLLKLKRKKNSFKNIIGFFFTPPLFLTTKVAISFVYCSLKTIKCTQKPKIEKNFTGIDQSSERARERVPFHTSYLQLALAHAHNSRVKKIRLWNIMNNHRHFFKALQEENKLQFLALLTFPKHHFNLA